MFGIQSLFPNLLTTQV